MLKSWAEKPPFSSSVKDQGFYYRTTPRTTFKNTTDYTESHVSAQYDLTFDGINTSLSVGAEHKMVMADLETLGDFCVYINSENYKYIALEKSNNKLGLTMHIAESVIGELMKYNDPNITHTEITKKMSEFYQKNFNKIKV